jgi:hypothetical protein
MDDNDSSTPPSRPQLTVVPSVEEVEGALSPRIVGAAEILESPLDPVDYLCPDLKIGRGAPVLFVGESFSGKTLILQDLALAVASGQALWGRFPVRRGRVLHLDYEQGKHLTYTRYRRMARARGILAGDLGDNLNLETLPTTYLDNRNTDDFARWCEGVDLLIIDAFRGACPNTDENSSEARKPLDRLLHLSEQFGTVCIVVHHMGKPSRERGNDLRNRSRGSTAFVDACNTMFTLEPRDGQIVVARPKERIEGTPAGVICSLSISDVKIGNDPKGGLAVEVCDTMSVDEAVDERPTSKLEKKIIALLEKCNGTFVGGVNAFAKTVGCNRMRLEDALAVLEDEGRVIKAGSRQQPCYVLQDSEAAELE